MTDVPQEVLGTGENPVRAVLQEGVCDLLTMRAPLHCAARLGKVPQLELLLEAGSPVDCLDGHGWTALQVMRNACTTYVPQLCRVCHLWSSAHYLLLCKVGS